MNFVQKIEAYNNVQPIIEEANVIKIKLNPIQYFSIGHVDFIETYSKYMEMVKIRDETDPKAMRCHSFLKKATLNNGNDIWDCLKTILKTCNQKPEENVAFVCQFMSPTWSEAVAKLMIMLNQHNDNRNKDGMILCFQLCIKLFDNLWFGSSEACDQIVNEYKKKDE